MTILVKRKSRILIGQWQTKSQAGNKMQSFAYIFTYIFINPLSEGHYAGCNKKKCNPTVAELLKMAAFPGHIFAEMTDNVN